MRALLFFRGCFCCCLVAFCLCRAQTEEAAILSIWDHVLGVGASIHSRLIHNQMLRSRPSPNLRVCVSEIGNEMYNIIFVDLWN